MHTYLSPRVSAILCSQATKHFLLRSILFSTLPCTRASLFLRVPGVPMAAVVATMVVGPLVKIVMEKVSGELLRQYKVMKGLDKQHDILKRRLLLILDIITDAEQTAADPVQAATRRAGAASWLEAIKKVAYQANEVFDEFKYEALRRKAKKEGHYDDLGFSMVKLFPTHNRFVFCNRMGRKLGKVVRAIELLVTEMNNFGFKYQQQLPVSNQWRQTDHVIFDPKGIAQRSREKDNKIIVDILVGQANNTDLTVVPIIGMGGLGKTMLAQLVYNEPKIDNHFDLLLWVCVSDSFDVDSLAKSIVEAAPEKNYDGTEAAVPSKRKNTPLDILQNLVSKRRYLLVLDDVWTREVRKWEKLKTCLEHGGKGSVVLTTTRDEGVAEIMGSVEAYNLGALGGEYIKEIIETTAFSRFKKEVERPAVLVNMVDEIVKRCAGSPLAAIALGSVLRNKTSEEEWKDVSNRSSICTAESGILPILNLSYNDLPQHMKQCFAFCAIFPKDYKIDVDKLIQLWIAHGFILEEKQVRLETIAKQIFNQLASRSFFQDVKQVQATADEINYSKSCYSRTTCKIHDLMHDVALSVMQNECALGTEESCRSEWLPNTARHIFLSCTEAERRLNSSLENSSPAIHTILCDGYSYMEWSLQHPSKYSSLQALQLRLQTSSFPLKPKHLHHLRYLDLSRSLIKALPEDMSILYNLQVLNLSGCTSLCELPIQMRYMTALRHLYTHGCPMLKSMPRDLRKLTSLQTLTCFVVGSGSNCSNVGELENLKLGGQLELRHLPNVTEKDASTANLVNKELRELTLKWTVEQDFCETRCRVDENDARVLEKLKPHDGLHTIRIHLYGATTFPTWMASLQNIVQIHLFSCIKLQWLFSHDSNTSFAFPNLTELTLRSLDNLERWWAMDNDEMQGEIIFPRLEKLFISFCKKLTVLPGHPTFPNLQNAHIEACPELTTRAKSPKLSVLKTEGCEAELFLWVARHMTSLTNLKLKSLEYNTETILTEAEHGLREVVDGKEKRNDHDFPLAVLELDRIKYSGVIELCACFVHLQDLSIQRCDGLVHWPEKEFQALVSLRRLVIYGCDNLIGYAQAPAEPSTSSETSQFLPHLESLEIKFCGSLVEVFNAPASLKRMEILSCSKLESISCRRLQPEQSALSINQVSSSIPDASSSSPGAGVEHLESLTLFRCHGLTGVLHLPPSLTYLKVFECEWLTSLESSSGELPSLEILELLECKTLSSLPDGPQAYASLRCLRIRDVPGMKTLPMSLQQRLGSIQTKHIDAHLYEAETPRPVPTLLKPKTWKYAICNN
ncbi:hypothetical protein VPH35_132999 [Triticum aestivum]